MAKYKTWVSPLLSYDMYWRYMCTTVIDVQESMQHLTVSWFHLSFHLSVWGFPGQIFDQENLKMTTGEGQIIEINPLISIKH